MIKKKIYILHGWTYSTEKWDEFVTFLKQEGFDVYLLKIPGLTSPLDQPLDLNDYVNWLASVLPKNEKVILLGHSNGGRIAAKFTSLYPERVQNLLLIDSAGIYDTRFVIQLKRVVFGTMAKFGKNIVHFPLARTILYKASRERDYLQANPVMRETMKNLIQTDLTEDFKKIKVPTLIIWGKYDTATPFIYGKLIHSLISHSKFFVLEDARHSPMFTHAKKVAEIIKREVAKV